MPADPATSISSLTYPRTGKRGVPQQFPRRLYEMLEGEAKLAEASPNEKFVISWSESGKAFRILDVELFATTVLPRYFRTKKFSSFQRNLNLYGFAKVRRGPDTDMYAHPAFVRGQPETLSQLRKTTSASRRQLIKSHNEVQQVFGAPKGVRSVSPSPTRDLDLSSKFFQPIIQRPPSVPFPIPEKLLVQPFVSKKSMVSPDTFKAAASPPQKANGIGRLDLLTLALEREGCFAN